MGGKLLRALLQRERCCHLSNGRHRTSAHHGGVRCYTNTGRTCSKAPGNDGIPPRPDQALQDHPFAASTRHPLPVLEWRWCPTRHERCQDRHPVLKQRRQERLKQLQMHLPLEHRGKTVCQSPVSASPIAGGTCLPRLPMHLSSRTFYSGHDLLPSPTTGEVQGAAEAPLYRLHIFDHFVPPRLEGQSVQHSGSCPRQSPYNVHAAHGYPPPPPGPTSALCATETATPALVLPATDDAAPVATPRSGRVQFPWWTSTWGGLLQIT